MFENAITWAGIQDTSDVNLSEPTALYVGMLSALLFLAVSAALPAPTGPLAVGRVTVEWVDRSRIEPLSPDHGYRALMVDIWYPADASPGASAPYLDAAAFERAIGAAGLRRQLGDAYDAIKEGRVQTHAVVSAPFSHSVARAPVLMFSPGGGLVRELYAAQIEDLVSHGYVVAAITHPYDGIVTVYPDGHWITYDPKRWPEIPDFPGKWNLNQLEWHAKDIRFVLEELERANHTGTPGLPFAGHLDFGRVGAFGHSFGGVAAAQACQSDRRIRACLNEDGLAGKAPFDLDAGAWGMNQRFMLIQRAGESGPPPDEELVKMKITRERANEVLARLDRDHDAALQAVRGGSYEVVLNNSKTTHMDFTDLPLLGAQTPASADAYARVLAVVRQWTLAFFDESLRGRRSPLLGKTSAGELVQSTRRISPTLRP
jgi:predicted dienelactone hydrolase